MIYTYLNLRAAILHFGRKLKKENVYLELLKITAYPEMIKIVSYDLFLADIHSYFAENDLEYEYYRILVKYGNELKKDELTIK